MFNHHLFCVVSFLLQRLIQYLASRNTLFNLHNFLDKGKTHKPSTCVVCTKYQLCFNPAVIEHAGRRFFFLDTLCSYSGCLECKLHCVCNFFQCQWWKGQATVSRSLLCDFDLSFRLWHVNLHQEIQSLSQREGHVLQAGGCGFHKDETRVGRTLFPGVYFNRELQQTQTYNNLCVC